MLGGAYTPYAPVEECLNGVDFVTMHTLLGHVHVHATVRS